MKISVVILNYNVRHFLELCLKSVEAALVNISSEIIVVDNNSQDESCSMVKSLFPQVLLIRNSKNLGFSKGNNIGVARAEGEFICILNPDTVVAEDTFKILLNFAEKQKNIGIVGCKLIDGRGNFLPESKRHVPSPLVSTKKMLGATNDYYVPEINENTQGRVEILVGAFMLIKKEIYNLVGGFDEDYFMYGEDVDLSYKVLKAGYTNFYNGYATVIHFKGESTTKDKVYIRRFYGAMQIFYRKHFKSNLLFNAVVWAWVRIASLIFEPRHISDSPPRDTVMVSKKNYRDLENTLGKRIIYESQLSGYKDNTAYILDNSFLSFKQIVEIIDKRPQGLNVVFKILPKNSKFIIGSNNSENKGSIILFN